MHLAKGSHTPDKMEGSLVAVKDTVARLNLNFLIVLLVAGACHLEVIKLTILSRTASESQRHRVNSCSSGHISKLSSEGCRVPILSRNESSGATLISRDRRDGRRERDGDMSLALYGRTSNDWSDG